ncbi:hypothetical protein RIF29_20876 [Crotalaria pallida]|uniref:Uncharacterized protein n=1 Tax=Crotalaria pallida TaxID=3830 RepID=A0AAN9F6E9_CROPI
MGLPSGGEGPAILHLHKWDPSEAPLELSEFREAFLSPTRETLLLHSYQREALLVPLTKGEPHSSGPENVNDDDNHNPSLSHAFTRPGRSDLVNDVPCTSGSEIDIDPVTDPAKWNNNFDSNIFVFKVFSRWDIKISRIRQLQIALEYLKFDEIERSLEMLVDVNLEEEGILRLLFAATYLILNESGNDSETSAASRYVFIFYLDRLLDRGRRDVMAGEDRMMHFLFRKG